VDLPNTLSRDACVNTQVYSESGLTAEANSSDHTTVPLQGCPSTLGTEIPAALSPQLQQMHSQIADLERELREERRRRELAERSLGKIQQEVEDTTNQLEQAIEQANRMACASQITNIELKQIFNTSADGMWVIDKNFNILRINETFLALLSRTAVHTVGEKCYKILPCIHCHGSACPMTRLSRGEHRVENDIEIVQADGSTKCFIATSTPFTGIDGQMIGLVEAYKDITERRQIQAALEQVNEELERLATLDGLTGIPNRRQFDERFGIEWKRARRDRKPLALILCDVDRFKLYNDNYGHQAGDDCLRAVAQCISSQLKRVSDLPARYGGEEFAIILPDTDEMGACCVAEAIRSSLAMLEIGKAQAKAGCVTASFGAASIIPAIDAAQESLIKAADSALYKAKEKGRNRVELQPVS
jgi:diguanylate cyclase (GGDEF)-like protein/PAS domain S-box-containing protein